MCLNWEINPFLFDPDPTFLTTKSLFSGEMAIASQMVYESKNFLNVFLSIHLDKHLVKTSCQVVSLSPLIDVESRTNL